MNSNRTFRFRRQWPRSNSFYLAALMLLASPAFAQMKKAPPVKTQAVIVQQKTLAKDTRPAISTASTSTPITNGSDSKFFGFSEFLAGLALMALVWTMADIRYRFRVRTAPLPVQGITFVVVCIVGVSTLLIDWCRAEHWSLPFVDYLTMPAWQALLGAIFLLTFLTWAWYAFIRPPIYGKLNAERYARALYWIILKGAPSELSVIADELGRSAESLIRHATEKRRDHGFPKEPGDAPIKEPAKVAAIADDILLLIADKRFCRAIVESAPGSALDLFDEIGETKKYRVRIGIFAKNIVSAAMENKDSFLFNESEGYESGLLGYHKPLSQAIFSNYFMVEEIGTLLDPDIEAKSGWDAEQWKAYCRVVLITFRDYTEHRLGIHSYALYRAKGYIERAVSDLYKLNGIAEGAWDHDVHERLRVVVTFAKDAIKILDAVKEPPYICLRIRKNNHLENFYDHLAEVIFELIFSASHVRSPSDLCWSVQHNSVWGEFFNFGKGDGPAAKIVQFKVRRLIYDEIASMRPSPNFKGAKYLGFCLNVMGFPLSTQEHDSDTYALQKTVLSWTKKNFAWLHSYNPRIAQACLVDGITYDKKRSRLVKTYPAGLQREPTRVYFDLDPAPPIRKEPK